jgi:transcriptional regulator with XRE-family HTH domain
MGVEMEGVTISDDERRKILMEFIRELRARFGSDREIERASGINYTRISRWANGDLRSGITLANLVRLAEVSEHSLGDMMIMLYGVSPEQLVPTTGTECVGAVVHGPDGRRGVRRLPGRYRMLLLMREDDEDDPRGRELT